ncbi:DUF7601 domain-containing protein [Desulforamulus aeronauticus]|uniref:Uncharacterized protein n=1 Tax=Desulforamulus aeronauticus DSM 10349 TaxID=1121421 RepID=A0A1M6VT12_9FIRM|nr:hypothetical protein [Desulforamulus aeronauticus]SHK84643.1 hypothetical protein SAMN02745123_03338 [Desulforamulus aeronauticus DSM 10349]
MKNQNKRFIGRLLSRVLAIVLCFGMAVPAFAAGPILGTEVNPATAAITKTLKMPEGTTIPGVTFGFTFEKKALNEKIGADYLAQMPVISNHVIAFTSGDNPTSSDGIKSITKEVLIDLTGVTFPNAGVYTYKLTELPNITNGSIDPAKETLVYSKAVYEITFFVREKSDHSGLYVSAIGTKIMQNEEGSPGSGAKVDPTPGTGGGLGAGGLLFTNSYMKTTGGVDPRVEANQVLRISNVVAGDFADTSMYFKYLVTVKKPLVAGAAARYKAYVLNASGIDIDPTQNAPGSIIQTDAAGKKYIEFAAHSSITIKLKHDEKLVFTDVPVGALYVAVNQGAADYIPTAKITVNGTVLTPDLSAGVGQSLITDNIRIGENTNKADFTNTFKSIPVTGLIINNLPFIMILVIAAGAFIAFILMKLRKRRNSAVSY